MIWMLRNIAPIAFGAAIAYALTALTYGLILTPQAVHKAETVARAEVTSAQMQAAITELARQRESVRAATASLASTLSEIQAQNDAALAGLEQEIADYEGSRDPLTGDCVLSDADADWLRGR